MDYKDVHGFPMACNYAFVYGCDPTRGVKANTTMIKDLADILSLFYDRKTMAVQFPDCFNDLLGHDANFEMVQSNTLVPMKFIHKANKVMKNQAFGVIFVHTHIHKELGDDTILKGKKWSEWRGAFSDNVNLGTFLEIGKEASLDEIRESMNF